ncbi:MAG TPA: SagB/ThcOx family dehydrogenase [Candidatus Methanoculleus thermohydrogenotrophicum]|jgi:SagB-type dehydrogenase family enzyme|nr:SagB/ThcOx family dehydrogenase [Candidatus Methanoculleus thermohydrogenotrophicum]NLM82013.1 SagB/ThcOx family dehydrogenase [Candidatus Methanoculleus thermohydrogenotrophicum]HOB17296.1 SagB/ThcOx family dehydrogenase [Candidatus Methanoculleus thermohydrogenotrophicum]HPZ37419.1 SagB/ThcOx family dehydrogenase [Candidatus Methanoculleus thermohydrogenotrophicum]HQC90904.1 SagB/ThcOx family dehydrogenase [Candidatus Methanoculleus thermohydrogenotrophicum]
MDRKHIHPGLIIIATTFALVLVSGCAGVHPSPGENSIPAAVGASNETVTLPEPRYSGSVSVEEALRERRSVRIYAEVPLMLTDVGQVLWAAQGVTDGRGYRTAPSAGALYPLEVYLVAGDVMGLEPGVYHYQPAEHLLIRTGDGDRRATLQAAAVNQTSVGDAPATIVICAVPDRTTVKYGDRGMRYVFMEAGHASENIYLQATAINLGTVTIGAFDDDEVGEILGLPGNTTPLYLMPVGRPVPGMFEATVSHRVAG